MKISIDEKGDLETIETQAAKIRELESERLALRSVLDSLRCLAANVADLAECALEIKEFTFREGNRRGTYFNPLPQPGGPERRHAERRGKG